MKYSVITFGCRVNQADSLGFEEELRAAGASASSPEEADLVVVNTCSVTSSADQGARQTIRRIARTNPDARIVVTGCYATRRPDEVGALPNVLQVVPNDDKPRLVPLLRQAVMTPVRRDAGASFPDALDDVSPFAGVTTAERFGAGEGSCGAAIEPGVAGRTAFTLRVQTGCAEPCSYCIIPTTRGAPRSVPMEAVLRTVERVAAAGFKEIAITGVHLGSYGRDLNPPSSLTALLERLDAARQWESGPSRASTVNQSTSSEPPGGVIFRISSLEPMDCTPETVALVASSGAFAPHFHLPLQHASNAVLRAMRRPYTIEQYSALVDVIRTRIPDAAIGSDIIVGFPGETGDDFEMLIAYLERSPLTHLHVFPYSDRPGTLAAGLRGKVPGAVVRERAARARAISCELAKKFRASQAGTLRRALTLEDGSIAVTGNYLKVKVPPGHGRNEWIQVEVS